MPTLLCCLTFKGHNTKHSLKETQVDILGNVRSPGDSLIRRSIPPSCLCREDEQSRETGDKLSSRSEFDTLGEIQRGVTAKQTVAVADSLIRGIEEDDITLKFR